MHKTEFVRKNEMHKILFEIQMDHKIKARRPNLILLNKKERICHVDFVAPADLRAKMKEIKKRESVK